MLFSHRARIAGTPAANVSFRNYYSNTASGLSYTFTDTDIGSQVRRRLVVVVIHTQGSTSGAVATMTIGGVTATKAINDGLSQHVGIWYAQGVSGANATVVATCSSATSCSIGVYALYNLSRPSPVATASSLTLGGTTNSASLVGMKQNMIVISGLTGNPASATTTWNNTTERYDSVPESGVIYTGSDLVYTSATSPFAPSTTLTTACNNTLCASSWI